MNAFPLPAAAANWQNGEQQRGGGGGVKGGQLPYLPLCWVFNCASTYATHGLARRPACLLPFASMCVHVGMSVHVCACVCLHCGYVELMMLAYFINMNSVCVAYLSHHK